MEICSDLKGHTHRWIWVRIPQVSMASDPMAWGSYPDPSPLCGEYYAKEKKKNSTKQQADPHQAVEKLKNQRPKASLKEGRGKPCLPAVLKGFASSQRTISGEPTGLVLLLTFITEPPSPPCPATSFRI